MAGAGDRGSVNPQGTHPRIGAGLPEGPSGTVERLQEAASSVGQTAGQMAGHVRESAREFASRAEETWESAQESMRRGASQVASSAQDFWSNATDLIRRYPVASLAIAFGVGCLVATSLSAARYASNSDMTERMSRYSS